MPWLDSILEIALGLMVLAVLGIVAYRDAKTHEIPDALSLSVLVLGVVALIIRPETGLAERVIGLVAVSGPMLLLTLLRPGAIGGGDIKLMAAAGFLLGWQAALLAASLGILLAGLEAIWRVAVKQAKLADRFAFGPALAIGIAIAYFFSSQLLHWLFGLG